MNKNKSYTKLFTFMIVGAIALIAVALILTKSFRINSDTNKAAISINDDKITVGELNFYVASAKSYFNVYEAKYTQSGYDLWTSQYNDEMTVADYIKSVSIENSIKDYILAKEALANGLELTKDEVLAYQEELTTLLEELTDEEKETYSLDKKTLEPIYKRKALADKYYNTIIKEANLDEEALVKDIKLEDYQQYKYEYLEFPFGTSDSADVQNYISEEDKKDAYQLMTEIYESLNENSDLKAIAAEKLVVNYNSATTLMGDGTLATEFETALIPLKTNEFSQIFETDQGYFIVRKLGDTSKMAYLDAKNDIIESAKSEAFNAVYTKLLENYTITKNNDTINTISIRN